jgi:murein DD-endopeptidase MepM/ murein hydrolase activator NlpD
MPLRRIARIVVSACVTASVVLALGAAPAAAESVSTLRARLRSLAAEAEKAGKAYDRAYWALDETEVALGKTKTQIADTERELEEASARLNARAADMYRTGDVAAISFLVNAASYEELLTRWEYMRRIGVTDADAVAEVKALNDRLEAQQAELEATRTKQAAAVKDLRSQRDSLQRKLASVRGKYEAARAQLDRARSRGRARPAGIAAMPGGTGMTFPVAGANYYSDTWGASRSGGRRSHKGTDIMAANGTPCVAVTDGTVSASSSGLGGLSLWLSGSNGWTYYYAHLSGYAVKSGSVRAGQVIGYVGSTGNARGGSPHLHFEMHPGGGGAVNPYPYLRAMQ